MPEVELHVCPTAKKMVEVYWENRADPAGVMTCSPGMGLHGLRASMLYIHGNPSQWKDESRQEWLKASAMTRLVDSNPARVVWLHDA